MIGERAQHWLAGWLHTFPMMLLREKQETKSGSRRRRSKKTRHTHKCPNKNTSQLTARVAAGHRQVERDNCLTLPFFCCFRDTDFSTVRWLYKSVAFNSRHTHRERQRYPWSIESMDGGGLSEDDCFWGKFFLFCFGKIFFPCRSSQTWSCELWCKHGQQVNGVANQALTPGHVEDSLIRSFG